MTPHHPRTLLCRTALVAIIAAFGSGCSLLSTTTDTVAEGLEATTNTTDASTDASTDSVDSADARTRAEAFVRTDLDAIRADAARGHGETLETLAYLLDESDTAAFGRWMQTHYEQLFTDLEQPEALLARIDRYRDTTRMASNSSRHTADR